MKQKAIRKPIFGTQAQQDAAWLKATGEKRVPSPAELDRRSKDGIPSMEKIRQYNSHCRAYFSH